MTDLYKSISSLSWVFLLFCRRLWWYSPRTRFIVYLYLVLTFFAITGEYVLLNAQFIAIVNIIVYAGAIMVLFLFVMMLLNLNKETEPHKNPLPEICCCNYQRLVAYCY